MRTFLVTGGAGFIGGALCRFLVASGEVSVVNVDSLTYAANPASLTGIARSPRYRFVEADIADGAAMRTAMADHDVDAIVHLAAESHVDRSIDDADPFVRTNVEGTVALLAAATAHWRTLPPVRADAFRFVHVSTDEVFGDLPLDGGMFSEASRYAPSSPYAASKAASDHFVRAWHTTHGLPVLIANSGNNYGPYQLPEKLIPLAILNGLEGKDVPLYGAGTNVRDWIHVEDHVRALAAILAHGRVGKTYAVGARSPRSNREVVEAICDGLDRRRPLASGRSRRGLIRAVEDRPGHDRRYAIDPTRIESELGWRPMTSFEAGLEATIDWYLANEEWWRPIRERLPAARLGLGI